MPVNPYFNNYNALNEQSLVEDLMVEAIKQYGFEGYYLPNNNVINRDLLWGEDPLKAFTNAYAIELYMTNSENYLGDQEFFSKFGLEIRNNVNVLVSRRSFGQIVPMERPNEGDLVYIPFTGASGKGELYEIKIAVGNKDYFVLGRKYPYFYELELEKFKYSHEEIDTGVEDIDIVMDQNAYKITFNMGTGIGDYIHEEIVYQGTDLANANSTAVVSSWNSTTKVLDLIEIRGNFSVSANISGNTSGATYSIANYDEIDNSQEYTVYDNKVLKTESVSVVDLSESNPFGTI